MISIGTLFPDVRSVKFGTVTAHVGIIVTMSVHKDQEAQFVAALSDMMKTLNVYER